MSTRTPEHVHTEHHIGHLKRRSLHHMTGDAGVSECTLAEELGPRTDPRGALAAGVDTLRRLYSGRSARWEENEELLVHADRMGCIVWLVHLTAARIGRLGELDREFEKVGLPDLLLDIVASEEDEFLAAPMFFVDSILEVLCRFLQNKWRLEVLQSRSSAIWRRLWQQRRHFAIRAPEEHQYEEAQLRPTGVTWAEPVVSFLGYYVGIHQTMSPKQIAPGESFMPHVALWFWCIDSNLDVFKSVSYYTLNAYGKLLNSPVSFQPSDVVKDAILAPDTLGADRFFARLNAMLTHGVFVTQGGLWHPCQALLEMLALTDVPAMYPHVRKYRTHEHLVHFTLNMVRGSGLDDPAAHVEAMGMAAVTISRQLLEDKRRRDALAAAEGMRAQDLIALLALMLDLITLSSSPSVEKSIEGPSKTIGKEGFTCHLTVILSSVVSNLKRQHAAKSFLDDLKAQLRIDWWPSYRALQAAHKALPLSKAYRDRRHDCESVMGAWLQLGSNLGLDLDAEQKRHGRDAARRCLWFICPHHRATDDSLKLSSCKGCGDARYCGRNCQKRDWIKGGHKKKCRRIKG
ncbi:unnamed protein product [Peniophora sp. CBMAI 1063]|nr:unnamed protein product [Peniophora sp. CBMAI 1063]